MVRLFHRIVQILAGFLALLGALVVLVLALGALATAVIAWVVEQRYPPGGRSVEVEGGRIAVIEAGPGEGRPQRGTVVLLHGASGNAADPMQGIGRKLAGDGFRVIALDRPGFGYSDRIRGLEAASPAVQGAILAQALDRLGVGPAILVGHSWSGALATAMALDHPEHVAALALLAPATHPWPGGGIAWYYHTAAMRLIAWTFTRTITAPVGLYLMRDAMKVVFAPQPVPPDYVDVARIPLVLRPATFMANAEDLTGLHDFVAAQRPRYGAIRVPTLVMAGDRDRIVDPDIHARALAREIPGAELVMLPGVGHMLHFAAADRVVEGIEALAARAEAAHAPQAAVPE